MKAFLEVNGLSKRFGEETVLEKLEFSLESGKTLSVLGRSGCGKTTLLKLIAGLERPDSGSVCLDGTEITHLRPQHRRVVYLYQEPLLFPHLSVRENLAFGLRIRKVEDGAMWARVDRMLDQLGLEKQAGKHTDDLSGGQRQRVSFGRAIIVNPPLVLLDEPFGNLDVEIRADMQKLFEDLASEYAITTIFVTHDLKEAIQMGDSISTMSNGRLHVYESLNDFVTDPSSGVESEREFWSSL